MATKTINYNLTKPELNETADIQVINENMDIIDGKLKEINNGVTSHQADNSKQVPHLGTTTNSGDAYSITTAEVIDINQKFTIKFNAASTSAPTLKINTREACAIKKANGNNAKLYASVYTLFWDGSAFILLGEGGDYGTALAGDVRSTKTIGTENGVIQGTLDLSKLTALNVRKDVNIGGVVGSLVPKYFASGNAVTSANTERFEYFGGGLGYFDSVTVTGLSFKPSVIILKYVYNSTYTYVTVYEEVGSDNYSGPIARCGRFGINNDSYYNYSFKGDVEFSKVSLGSFKLPCANFGAGKTVNWYALG